MIQLLDSVGADEWSMLGVDGLATDPVDPNRVYLATGMYTNDWTDMNGAIMRSTDKGKTWARTMLPFKMGGNIRLDVRWENELRSTPRTTTAFSIWAREAETAYGEARITA